jgi:hypothetical protein
MVSSNESLFGERTLLYDEGGEVVKRRLGVILCGVEDSNNTSDGRDDSSDSNRNCSVALMFLLLLGGKGENGSCPIGMNSFGCGSSSGSQESLVETD